MVRTVEKEMARSDASVGEEPKDFAPTVAALSKIDVKTDAQELQRLQPN